MPILRLIGQHPRNQMNQSPGEETESDKRIPSVRAILGQYITVVNASLWPSVSPSWSNLAYKTPTLSVEAVALQGYDNRVHSRGRWSRLPC